MMADFTIDLTGLVADQTAGTTLFLGVCVRVSLGEISI